MSDTVRDKATQSVALVEEVNAQILPDPAPADAVVSLEKADAPQSAEIKSRMAEIDMGDTQSIIGFGSGAQAELQEIIRGRQRAKEGALRSHNTMSHRPPPPLQNPHVPESSRCWRFV